MDNFEEILNEMIDSNYVEEDINLTLILMGF